MQDYTVILGMAAVTYATRALGVFLLARRLPPLLEQLLGYVPVAVFAALLAPPLLLPQGTFALGVEAAAALPAALTAWWTRQVLPTILVGMGCYWLIRWLA